MPAQTGRAGAGVATDLELEIEARRAQANGLARLEGFGPVCLGLDIAGLRADATRCQAELSRLGPEGLKRFDLDLLPEIRVVAEGA